MSEEIKFGKNSKIKLNALKGGLMKEQLENKKKNAQLIFDALDSDKNGKLDKKELSIKKDQLDANNKELNLIFDSLDKNKDGILDKKEISVSKEEIEKEYQTSLSIFEALDADNNGVLDDNEMALFSKIDANKPMKNGYFMPEDTVKFDDGKKGNNNNYLDKEEAKRFIEAFGLDIKETDVMKFLQDTFEYNATGNIDYVTKDTYGYIGYTIYYKDQSRDVYQIDITKDDGSKDIKYQKSRMEYDTDANVIWKSYSADNKVVETSLFTTESRTTVYTPGKNTISKTFEQDGTIMQVYYGPDGKTIEHQTINIEDGKYTKDIFFKNGKPEIVTLEYGTTVEEYSCDESGNIYLKAKISNKGAPSETIKKYVYNENKEPMDYLEFFGLKNEQNAGVILKKDCIEYEILGESAIRDGYFLSKLTDKEGNVSYNYFKKNSDNSKIYTHIDNETMQAIKIYEESEKIQIVLSSGKKADVAIIDNLPEDIYGKYGARIKVATDYNGTIHYIENGKEISKDKVEAYELWQSPKNRHEIPTYQKSNQRYVKTNSGKVYYFFHDGQMFDDDNVQKVRTHIATDIAKHFEKGEDGWLWGMGTNDDEIDKAIEVLSACQDPLIRKYVESRLGNRSLESIIDSEYSGEEYYKKMKNLLATQTYSVQDQGKIISDMIKYETTGGFWSTVTFGKLTYTRPDCVKIINSNINSPEVRHAVDKQFGSSQSIHGSNTLGFYKDSMNLDDIGIDTYALNFVANNAYSRENEQHLINGIVQSSMRHYFRLKEEGKTDKEIREKTSELTDSLCSAIDVNAPEYQIATNLAAKYNTENGYKGYFTNQEDFQTFLAEMSKNNDEKVDAEHMFIRNNNLYRSVIPADIQAQLLLYDAQNGDYSNVFNNKDPEVYKEVAKYLKAGNVKGCPDLNTLYNKALNSASELGVGPTGIQIKARALLAGIKNFSNTEIVDICIGLMHEIDTLEGSGNSTNGSNGWNEDAQQLKNLIQQIITEHSEIKQLLLDEIQKSKFEKTTMISTQVNNDISLYQSTQITTTHTANTNSEHLNFVNNINSSIVNEEVFYDENGNRITDEALIAVIKDQNLQTVSKFESSIAELKKLHFQELRKEGVLSNIGNAMSEHTGMGTDRDEVSIAYDRIEMLTRNLKAAAKGKYRENGKVVSFEELSAKIQKELENLQALNTSYQTTQAITKAGLILAPVVIVSTALSMGSASMVWVSLGGAATQVSLEALEGVSSKEGLTSDKAKDILKSGGITAATMGLGGRYMKFAQFIKATNPAVQTVGRLSMITLCDTATGIAAEAVLSGEVTIDGTVYNAIISLTGNIISIKTIKGDKAPKAVIEKINSSSKPIKSSIQPKGRKSTILPSTKDEPIRPTKKGKKQTTTENKTTEAPEKTINETKPKTDSGTETPGQTNLSNSTSGAKTQVRTSDVPKEELELRNFFGISDEIPLESIDTNQLNKLAQETKVRLLKETYGNAYKNEKAFYKEHSKDAEFIKISTDINLYKEKLKAYLESIQTDRNFRIKRVLKSDEIDEVNKILASFADGTETVRPGVYDIHNQPSSNFNKKIDQLSRILNTEDKINDAFTNSGINGGLRDNMYSRLMERYYKANGLHLEAMDGWAYDGSACIGHFNAKPKDRTNGIATRINDLAIEGLNFKTNSIDEFSQSTKDLLRFMESQPTTSISIDVKVSNDPNIPKITQDLNISGPLGDNGQYCIVTKNMTNSQGKNYQYSWICTNRGKPIEMNGSLPANDTGGVLIIKSDDGIETIMICPSFDDFLKRMPKG